MTITDTRKTDIIAAYGVNNCVTDDSWKNAVLADLTGENKIYSDDMVFLYTNIGFCVPAGVTSTPTTPGETGVYIDTGGLHAEVWVGGTLIGTTDNNLDLPAGTYPATLKKTGYDDLDISLAIVANTMTTVPAAMVETIGGITSTPTGGGEALLVWTGNRKFPTVLKLGQANWFGLEMRNDGTKIWKGYFGVRLTDQNGKIFQYDGDVTKVTSVAIGVTKYCWCLATLPTDLVGTIKVVILKHTTSS